MSEAHVEVLVSDIYDPLTDTCLTYLSFDNFNDSRSAQTQGVPLVQREEYPFYQYSAHELGTHLRQSLGSDSLLSTHQKRRQGFPVHARTLRSVINRMQFHGTPSCLTIRPRTHRGGILPHHPNIDAQVEDELGLTPPPRVMSKVP